MGTPEERKEAKNLYKLVRKMDSFFNQLMEMEIPECRGCGREYKKAGFRYWKCGFAEQKYRCERCKKVPSEMSLKGIPRTRIHPDVVRKIEREYKRGKSMREIAENLYISHVAVARCIDAFTEAGIFDKRKKLRNDVVYRDGSRRERMEGKK